MEHLSCDGCYYYRKGKCEDWTVAALLGGAALNDGENRKCWEAMPAETEVDEGAENVEGE